MSDTIFIIFSFATANKFLFFYFCFLLYYVWDKGVAAPEDLTDLVGLERLDQLLHLSLRVDLVLLALVADRRDDVVRRLRLERPDQRSLRGKKRKKKEK